MCPSSSIFTLKLHVNTSRSRVMLYTYDGGVATDCSILCKKVVMLCYWSIPSSPGEYFSSSSSSRLNYFSKTVLSDIHYECICVNQGQIRLDYSVSFKIKTLMHPASCHCCTCSDQGIRIVVLVRQWTDKLPGILKLSGNWKVLFVFF